MTETATSLQTLTRLELYFSIRHINRTMKLFGPLFENDYESVIIFLSVAEVCLQAIFHLVALDPEHVDMEKLYDDINSVGVTALSIAEQTSIPRETVRRKLKTLMDRGLLAVSPKTKHVYLPTTTITSPEFIDLFGVHVRDIAQLVRTVAFYQRDPM